MKNFVTNTVKFLVLGLVFLGLFSCDDMMKVGLGEPVDVTKPVITITSPAKNESVYTNKNFDISGTVEDDIKVAKVTVYWDDDSGSVNATVNGNKWTASIPFDRIVGRNNVLFTAYAFDTDGKKSEPSYCTVYIDDQGPTVLVKAPQYNTVDIIEKSTYIVIEGQSWDYSPVMSVKVEFFAVNDTSKPLFPALEAEGTSSWTIQVPLSTFSDESDFIYRVTATDKAGNSNSYMYHIDDFHKIVKDLKDANQLKNPDDYIFPAISEIGYWDQDGTDLKVFKTDNSPVFTVDDPATTADDGTTIREQLQISMTPEDNVLRFRNDTNIDKPEISLSNLDKDAAGDNNAIGVGVPIYASATDDKDGIDSSSIQLHVFESGSTTPLHTVAATNFNAPGNGLYASFEFDLDGSYMLKPGSYTGAISLKDKRGTESKQCSFSFLVDQGAPSIVNINPGSNFASVSAGLINLEVDVRDDNEGFTADSLQAVIYDTTAGLPGTEISGVTIIQGKEDPEIINSEVFYKCSYAIAIPAGITENILAKISVKDKTGVMVNAVREYKIDTSEPTLTINYPTTAAIKGTSFTSDGTAADLGGSAVSKVEVAIVEGHVSAPPTGMLWETAENTDAWYKKHVISGLSEGKLTFFARPIDFAGNTGSFQFVNFSYDIEEPQLTATNEPTKYITSDFTFSGTLTDSNGLDTIDIQVSKNDGTPVSVSGYPKTLSAAKSFNWSTDILVPADGSADAEYEYTITATDISGRQAAALKKTVIIDATKPAFNFNTPSINDQKVNGIIYVSGDSSDTAGLTTLSLFIKEESEAAFTKIAEITPATATNTFDAKGSNPSTLTSWNKAIDTSGYADGRYIAEIRATDKAGNTGSAECSWLFDQTTDLPFYEFLNINPAGTKEENSIASTSSILGRVKDDDAVNVSSIKYKVDTGIYKPISGTSGSGVLVDWSISVSDLSSGEHTIQFTAEDINGKSVETGVIYFMIDAGPPSITADELRWNSNIETNLESRVLINDIPTIDFTAGDSVQVQSIKYRINNLDEQSFSITPSASISDSITLPMDDPMTDDGDPATTGDIEGLTAGDNLVTITATDSAGQNSSVLIKLHLDGTAPAITTQAADGTSQSGTIGLKGSVFEINEISILQYQIDAVDGVWIDMTISSSFYQEIDTTSLTEGIHTVYFRAEDKAGNVSRPLTALAADFSADEKIVLKVDQSEPEATISQSDNLTSKTSIAYSGTAKDGGTAAGTTAATAKLFWSLNGGTVTEVPLTVTAGNWNWTLDAAGGDGVYAIRLEVSDDATKVTKVTRTATIDTTAPTVAITAPAAGEASTLPTYTFTGTASDLGVGIDADSLTYSLDGSTPAKVSLSGASWTVTDAALGTEGSKTLTIAGADALGNAITPVTVSFYYDTAKPTLSEDTIGSSNIIFRNGNVTFNGDADDTNELASVTVSINGGPASADFKPSSGTAWTYELDIDTDGAGPADTTGLTEGTYTLIFTATDIAGKTVQLERNVTVDTTSPTLSVDAVNGWQTGEISIKGTATDAGSNIASVKYKLASESSWQTASGAAPWIGSLNLSAVAEGGQILQVQGFDNAGNSTAIIEQPINVDHNDPLASMSLSGTPNLKNNVDRRSVAFTLSGLAHDAVKSSDRAAKTVALAVTKDGTPVSGSPFTITPDATPADFGKWTYTQNVNAGTHADDGLYEYLLTVTDEANKSVSASKTVRIDTTAPTVAITAPVAGEASSMPTYTLTGTATDLGVGINPASLTYSLSGGASGTVSLSGASWSVPNVALGSEGAKTLTIAGADELGNAITPVSVNFYYDASNPTITETTVGTGNKLTNSNFDFGGTAGDSNALSTILISAERSGDSGWSKNWPASAAESWTHTINTADLAGDDTYVFTILVEDIAGKTAQLQRTVILDTTAPSVTAVDPSGASSWVRETFGVNGTATDANGLQSVEYVVDGGTTWQTVNVASNWYKDFDFTADEGSHTMTFRATDMAGNTTDAADYAHLTVNVDASAPELSITSPGGGSDFFVTGSFSINFTASDTNGAVVTTATHKAGSGNAVVSGSTITVTPQAASGSYDLDIVATDSVGKTTTKTFTYSYDQNIPTLVVSDLANGDIRRAGSLIINGTAADTAGESGLAKVEYSTDGSSWNAVNGLENWTVILTGLSEATGQQIHLKATDFAGRSSATTTIAYDIDGTKPTFDTDIVVDTVAPFDFAADTTTVSSPHAFGIDNNQIALKVRLKDNFTDNIKEVKATIPGAPSSPINFSRGTDEAGFEVWTSSPINISTITEGVSEWIITATDNCDYENQITRAVQIDKQAPVISKLTPQDSEVLNGEVTIKGTASDNANGSGLEKLEYKIGIDSAPSSWEAVSGSAYSWSIIFENLNIINNYANPTYATASATPGIWDLPIKIKGYDIAGNTQTTTITLQVDPDGDKPTADIIYPDPDELNRVMGGTIRLFGSAIDDDSVKAVQIMIDANADGVYDAGDDGFNGVDWFNGGNGQTANGTASWNMIINQNGEFNPAGSGLNEIKFCVRAIDIFDKEGLWSADQIIQIDKNVPQFGQAIFTDGTSTMPYVNGMYLKDSWDMVVEVTDDGNISGTNVTGNSAAVTESAIANGVKLTIPITTPAGSGPLNITVEATDMDGKTSKMTYSVNYDNENPTLDNSYAIAKIEQSNKLFELTSSVDETGSGFDYLGYYFVRQGDNARVIVPAGSYGSKATPAPSGTIPNPPSAGELEEPTADDPFYGLEITGTIAASGSDYTFTSTANEISSNELARVGNLIKIDGLFYKIATVSGNSITIKNAALNTSTTTAKLIYANIVDNTIAESPEWDGSNNLTGITNDDGDGLIESVYRYGTNYEWSASINSHAIPDGPIELHLVAFDKAGNFATKMISSSVENNGPKLAKITLGTDIDENGSISGSEYADPFDLADDVTKGASSVNKTLSFTAKDKTEIQLEIVGGNGELQYTLDNNGSRIHNLSTLRASEMAGITPITVTKTQLETIGDGAKTLEITVWDSTEETTIGTTSLNANLNLGLTVDVTDGNAPMAVIAPFYWIDENDNSLYQNDENLGHIEISGVYEGSDPEVSGQISVRGTAFDDQRIDELYMLIDNMTLSGTTKTFNAETYTLAATYSSGVWTGKNGTGWTFTAKDVSIDQAGHKIEWQLDWDTSKITNAAALDIGLKLVAVDKGNNNNAFTASGTSADITTYNVPSTAVDVVPYITKITTSLSQLYRSNPSVFNRTALGNYPVSENETIVIEGFNIDNSATVSLAGVNLGTVATSGSGYSINVGSAAVSGNLELFMNSTISSINNITDNTQVYNQKPNKLNNNLLSDDTVIDIWEFTEAATPVGGGVSKPTMKISPSGIVGFSYANAILYFNMPGTRNGAATIYSQTPYGKTWGGVTENTFAWDANDKTYGAALCPDTGSEEDSSANMMLYIQNPTKNVNAMDLWDTYNGNGGIRLENTTLSFDGKTTWTTDVNRTQNIQMETTKGSNINLYMAYFDSLTGQIRFRSGGINPTTGAVVNNYIEAGGDSTAWGGSDSDKKLLQPKDSLAANYHVIASNGTLTTATSILPSSSIAMAVSGDGTNDTAAIAWYDTVNRNLNFSFNDSVQGATNFGASEANWATNAKTIDAAIGSGIDVDMVIDSAGGVHIAYYSTAGGDLKYIYMDSVTDATPEIATIDSFLSVGTKIDIQVAKSGTDQIPYISYFMSSNKGTTGSNKIAYRVNFGTGTTNGTDAMDFYTGNWEISTVPTTSIPAEDNVSIGIYTDANGLLKAIPEAPSTPVSPEANSNSHAVGNSTRIYGNGTLNPAVAYATEDGILEMAQKK